MQYQFSEWRALPGAWQAGMPTPNKRALGAKGMTMPLFVARHLHKRFGDQVLSDIRLSVEQGEWNSWVPTAGKITRLPVSSGRVSIVLIAGGPFDGRSRGTATRNRKAVIFGACSVDEPGRSRSAIDNT